MTFSYTNTLPTSKDMVRFLLGDTVSATHLVEDEEITAILTSVNTIPNYAAAFIAEALAGKFAAQVDITIGETSVKAGDKMAHYKLLAYNLRQAGAGGDGTGVATMNPMTVGGVSIAEREAFDQDDSIIQPSFRLNKDDKPNPASAQDERSFWNG